MQALVSSSEFVKPPRKRSTRKSTFHGWTWEGVPIKKPIFIWPDKPPQVRNCYTTIRHYEGDIIRVRDSVLLRSGPKKTDLPFIAKVCDFWEAPETGTKIFLIMLNAVILLMSTSLISDVSHLTGDMMMSLLWYYRPEQTEPGRCPSHLPNEIFASKHRDVDSVACIDDKCYVLNYNEYCRYRKRQVMRSAGIRSSLTEIIVPNCLDKSLKHRLPPESVSSDIVFCCFKVYDFRQKRILKNPA
ncbi:Bromo adjacent domain-containing 1 protein-like protein [Dinothrombium tinctorium]|uniref:Bromo adjacent domain-containing 1 protein-like protein n=1 Tax=Dinothrombium tinctorium TaxID=1965070 RepID=A0A3S3NXU0_9ACAR|nr:Bromo adjacent domain-containing 1 protein-like protein [Dinothrombium tinctorium]RWS03973.1 Bromo adjacent domain-containing 1 protein-like protein [Dinothrombium tinctorium]